VPTEAETLDPRYTIDSVGMRATRLVHAGLVRLDPKTLEPLPYLAESWNWEGDRTLHINLRRDIRFHSGAPFTAEDVAATIRSFGAPSIASRHAHVVEAIDRVAIEDTRHLTIHLKRKRATLLTDLELPIMRRDEAGASPRSAGDFDGLGPFEIEKSTRGLITLRPAQNGIGPTPVHSVTLRTVRDENARALRFIGDSADIIVNGFSPAMLDAMRDQKGLESREIPGANLTYMVFETSRSALSNVHLRRAIAFGTPRESIARTLLGGHAYVATSVLPTNHWAFSEQPNDYPFDQKRATSELELARAAGAIPPLTLLTSTDRVRKTIARTIAQELRAIGLEVNVVPLELGAMLSRLAAGDFEFATLQIPEFTEPNLLKVFLHSGYVPPHGSNRGRVNDPELDALLDTGDTTQDPSARRAVYDRVEGRLREQLYIFPLWHENQVVVTSRRASGFVPSTEGRWLGLAELK